MSTNRVFLFLVMLALVPVTPLTAQNAADRLDRAFLVSGAPGVGLMWRQSERTDLGVSLNADFQRNQNDNVYNANLWLTLKRYLDPEARFSPYTVIELGPGWTHAGDGFTLWRLSAAPGVGLEWFPLERVSLGAHASLYLSWSQLRRSGDEGTCGMWPPARARSGSRSTSDNRIEERSQWK